MQPNVVKIDIHDHSKQNTYNYYGVTHMKGSAVNGLGPK